MKHLRILLTTVLFSITSILLLYSCSKRPDQIRSLSEDSANRISRSNGIPAAVQQQVLHDPLVHMWMSKAYVSALKIPHTNYQAILDGALTSNLPQSGPVDPAVANQIALILGYSNFSELAASRQERLSLRDQVWAKYSLQNYSIEDILALFSQYKLDSDPNYLYENPNSCNEAYNACSIGVIAQAEIMALGCLGLTLAGPASLVCLAAAAAYEVSGIYSCSIARDACLGQTPIYPLPLGQGSGGSYVAY
ncbi:MAG: hypothetical protein RL660_2447 [Bacteroidota bacterium]|jgi:hypothetical protein